MSYFFTSESVSEGHPDKIADQVSDALLDHFLAYDPESKVACETLVTTGQVVLAGEVKSKIYLDVQQIARKRINEIGYTKGEYKFSGDSCGVISLLHEQSSEINQGVERETPETQGAGDQGIMFGYATNETDVYMPLPIKLSHELLRELRNRRLSNDIIGLGPDAKSQFSIIYKDDKPVSLHSVVLSIQHLSDFNSERIKELAVPIIKSIIPEKWELPMEKLFINPTGNFEIGGPHGDAGLTGRKIVVDTYGGICPHGGGAFSGKDPSKVDRSGAYAARYIAKNIVAAGIAEKCTIQLAYIIGVAEPISIYLNTHNTGKVKISKIIKHIRDIFDLRPAGIRSMLDLARPIYQKTASFGHFGRDSDEKGYFTWESLDKVNELRKLL